MKLLVRFSQETFPCPPTLVVFPLSRSAMDLLEYFKEAARTTHRVALLSIEIGNKTTDHEHVPEYYIWWQ